MPTSPQHDIPSLRLVNITKAYGPVRVLDQAKISVRRGEVVALMGANGAGKSTLAKIAAGVVEPDDGQIFVADKELRLSSPRAARQNGIVIVHQSTHELGAPGLSVAENLVLDDLCAGTFGALAGKQKIERRAKAVAAGVGLELELNQDFGELGPAHRQLVAIARAVAANAAVLILDEPTASLSAAEAARLFSVVDRLRGLGVGILEAYEAGVARQAKVLGVDLHIFQGKQDAALQREQIEQAISLGVQGLVVSHGQPESLKDVVQKAVDAGIKVVAKDVDLGNPKVPLISQNDHEIARLVLNQALKDNGKNFPAGYVFVAGFRPLELRGEIWAETKKANPGILEKGVWGAVDSNTATTVASQTAAVLRAHPEIKVVFAPYDEFARGVKLGAVEAGVADQIKIYSADVSTSDIQDMREAGSPWVATSATNPAVVGEVSLRAVALMIAGQDPGKLIEVSPVLITQEQLNKNDIKTIADLDSKLPGFGHSDQATASWIASVGK